MISTATDLKAQTKQVHRTARSTTFVHPMRARLGGWAVDAAVGVRIALRIPDQSRVQTAMNAVTQTSVDDVALKSRGRHEHGLYLFALAR